MQLFYEIIKILANFKVNKIQLVIKQKDLQSKRVNKNR